jgi:hypothetical protein
MPDRLGDFTLRREDAKTNQNAMGRTLADASAAAESKPWRLGVNKGLGSLISEISRKGAK